MSRFVRICYTELRFLGKDLKIYFEHIRFGKTGIYNKVKEVKIEGNPEPHKFSPEDEEIFEMMINSDDDISAFRKLQEEHGQNS